MPLYDQDFHQVRIIRSPERVGLIRARLLGAAKAKAPALTFLDSHIECTPGDYLAPSKQVTNHLESFSISKHARLVVHTVIIILTIKTVVTDEKVDKNLLRVVGASVG